MVKQDGKKPEADPVEATNLTCAEGHTIRHFPQRHRKMRKNAMGRVSQPTFSSFTCQGCLQQVVLSQHGYYSCADTCDFDLCRNCTTCHIDGNILFESFEVPSQDTLHWLLLSTEQNYYETGSTTINQSSDKQSSHQMHYQESEAD